MHKQDHKSTRGVEEIVEVPYCAKKKIKLLNCVTAAWLTAGIKDVGGGEENAGGASWPVLR